jgi:hypothetical protein
MLCCDKETMEVTEDKYNIIDKQSDNTAPVLKSLTLLCLLLISQRANHSNINIATCEASTMAPTPAAPPSPQEITRKLSVHNSRSPKVSCLCLVGEGDDACMTLPTPPSFLAVAPMLVTDMTTD